jgi:hypothetical protein
MRPPEEHDITTSYGYTGKNLMKSYQGQLREAGFLDNGNAGRVESLWILERSDDGATLSNKDVYAHRFLKVDGQWEEVWRVYDMEFECVNNPVAEFVREAFTITDLDSNGVAEIWLMYIKSCKGDVSPENMFLRMYAGEEVYTLTGETRLVFSDGSSIGGEYIMDDNFLHPNTPRVFVDYAKALWEKHIQGK